MIGLGSQSQLGIGIAIQLQDQFSATADRVAKRLHQLRSQSRSMVDSAIRQHRDNYAMIAGAAGAVTLGYYRMAKAASEYGHKINQVDIIGEGKIGRTKKQLSELALGLSRDFATMPVDVAEAMLENTRAGVTKGMDIVTKYQLAVSKATGENVQSVSENLLGIANAMKIPLDQFGRVANATTAAANASMASVYSIGESMQYAAFTAQQFNIPMEQTLALVAKLSQSNIKGSSAGTALNNMILYLGAATSSMATKKQVQMFQMLGLDRGKLKAMMDQGKIFEAIATMDEAMSKIAPSDRVKMLANITNMRGARGMMGSWGSTDPSKSLRGLLASIQGGVNKDVAISQSRRMMDDPYTQFLRVQVAWEQFKIKFIGATAPMLMKILGGAEKFVNFMGKVANSPIGSVLGSVIAVGAPLVGVFFGLKAAALGLTLVFRRMQGIGFGSLFGAGLGMMAGRAPRWIQYKGIKGSGTNPYYQSVMGSVNQNKAGRFYVAPGQTFTYGGKQYNAGQLLPRSFQVTSKPSWGAPLKSPAGMMMGASLIGTGTTATNSFLGKMGNTVGGSVGNKILPTLGRAAGFLGRLLPIVGWGVTIWSIYDLLKSDKDKNEDPEWLRQKAVMDESLFSYLSPGLAKMYGSPVFQMAKDETNGRLQQTIQINIDGQLAMKRQLDQAMNNYQNYMQFNLQQ